MKYLDIAEAKLRISPTIIRILLALIPLVAAITLALAITANPEDESEQGFMLDSDLQGRLDTNRLK